MSTKLYTVQPGQSLSIIARDALNEIGRWQEIAYINGIKAPYVIMPGQVIKIPDLNSPPLVINVTGQRQQPTEDAPAGQIAGFSFSPATVILLFAGAFLLLGKK